MNNKESISAEEIPKEAVEVSPQEGNVEKKPIDIGRERIAAVGTFFSKVKEKAISLTSRVGGSISRFFSRVGKKTVTVAENLAAAPEFTKQAIDWIGKKVDEFAEKGVQKLADAEQWVADTSAKVSGAVSEKVEEFGASVGRTYAKAEEMRMNLVNAGVEKYHQFEDLCASGTQKVEDLVERSAKWAENKKQQAGAIVEEGVELAKDVAYIVEKKTVEGFIAAKEKIGRQYDNIVGFGEKTLVEAKLRYAEVKKKFRNTLNGWRASMLRVRIERLNAKNEKYLEALAKLEAVENNIELIANVDQIEAVA